MTPSPTSTELPLIARLLFQQGRLPQSSEARVQEALAGSARHPEYALIAGGFVDEKSVAQAHAEHLGIPWLSLGRSPTEDPQDALILEHRGEQASVERGQIGSVALNTWDVADLMSEALCRREEVMPVAVQDGRLDLACLNPSNFAAVEEVRMRAGCVVRLFGATPELLAELCTAIFGEPDRVREIASEGEGNDLREGDEGPEVLDLQAKVDSNPDSQVQRIVSTVFANAIDEGASDIHFEPYETDVRVRFRVDGKLREHSGPTSSLYVPAISRIKILASMDISERRIPQDGAIALEHRGQRVDLRVSTVPTIYGEKVVIRILEKSGIPDSLIKLGFSARQSEAFLDAARSPHGLMFVTGPTGSGKSTTLYTALNLINEPEENILTVEDPVEYRFHGLNQVQVHSKVGLSFASTLRAFLRQDPDKIMVGEVRDGETAEICMRAALTGHLVLSTLHTNSALQVINRLTDMGIEPFLLGPALRLVEAQRLARRLCPDCKVPVELPDETAQRHGLPAGSTVMRKGDDNSCETCRGQGCKGRVGLYEVVPVDEALRDAVIARASENELAKIARAAGTPLLADDARAKLLAGDIELAAVAQYIREVD
ncbi:MAG: hypothetical protein DHS20C15_28980 [Planctomycetota bacterium]|nr:MAG: hypothetical protein DHS20C15_28980 [Planctomycetota bacterium]